MTTRMKQTLGCMSLGLALATFTSSARANLLVDPGFEANPLTTASNVLNNFPTYQGQWGVESATITGVDGGVTPAQGTQMLRMTDDGLVATQAFQVTDVTVYAGLIDSGGATANLSALFNADKNVPAAIASVYVQFFSASNYGSQIGTPLNAGLTLDNTPGTWELISVSGAIPVNTRWILSQVMYNNASLVNNPGYVDAARFTVTPEPATLAALGLGSLAFLRRRRASTV